MNQLTETPKDAALRLVKKKIDEGFVLEALHEYTDQKGEILYWRLRLKNLVTKEKYIRPMKFSDSKGYEFGEPKFQNGKPLYNLKNLAAHPTDKVIVCEGEFCVDTFAKLGVLAITSGAADSATKANWQPLVGRSIIIWPDNDEPGLHFAARVAEQLRKVGCSPLHQIKVEELKLSAKGDVVDYLAIHSQATRDDIYRLATVDVCELITGSQQKENQGDGAEAATNQTQASELVDFVIERVELFHDANSDVYAKDLSTGEIRRLDSRQFKDWLVANLYELTGKSPRDQSIREALSTLGGIARHKGKCYEVYVRVAKHEDAYFIDLAETGRSRAIRVAPNVWDIVTDPPVCFLRPETLRPLPEPIYCEELSVLWKLINIPEGAQLLVLTWLIECLRPETPFPLLELIGEQGSAKSTTQKILRGLIDPNACDLRAAPKTVEDIFVSAGVNWLVSYENISHLSPAAQDALCVLATGGGFAKRKLYSDAEESVLLVQRPIVLNGISVSVTAQDLIDRTISIETPLITRRMETPEIHSTYKVERPKLLGALFYIFSTALANLPRIELPAENCPRLAEFVRLGMAVAKTIGKSSEEFLEQFNATHQESIARTIDASPVASALIDWFESCNMQKIVLPVKVLYEKVGEKRLNNTDAWPRSPKGFGDALRRAASALRQMGIECRSLGKTGSYISWEIKRRE